MAVRREYARTFHTNNAQSVLIVFRHVKFRQQILKINPASCGTREHGCQDTERGCRDNFGTLLRTLIFQVL